MKYILLFSLLITFSLSGIAQIGEATPDTCAPLDARHIKREASKMLFDAIDRSKPIQPLKRVRITKIDTLNRNHFSLSGTYVKDNGIMDYVGALVAEMKIEINEDGSCVFIFDEAAMVNDRLTKRTFDHLIYDE